MDAFVGSWKLEKGRTEGQEREYCQAIGIPEEHIEEFLNALYTVTIEKEGDDSYKYTMTVDNSDYKYDPGSFKLGEQFEFYDTSDKRTELITITLESSKTKEVTIIKEDPSVTWTVYRSVSDGEMIAEYECKGFKTTNYLKKC